MKKLLKSIALGLIMFLAVQVQAENNPKNGNLLNVEPVANYVSAEPQEIQQTPCIIYVEFCKQYIVLPAYIGPDCDKLAYHAQAVADIYAAFFRLFVIKSCVFTTVRKHCGKSFVLI